MWRTQRGVRPPGTLRDRGRRTSPRPVRDPRQKQVGEIDVAPVAAQPPEHLELIGDRPAHDVQHGEALGPRLEEPRQEVRLREVPGGHDYEGGHAEGRGNLLAIPIVQRETGDCSAHLLHPGSPPAQGSP